MSPTIARALRGVICVAFLGLAVPGCSSAPAADAAKNSTPPPSAPDATKDPEEQRAKAIQARLAAGMEALKMQDPERARRHITRALELEPHSAEANNAMALLYRYEGDDKREEEYFRKALRADKNYSQARNNYAGLLFRQGRYKEAVGHLEKAANDTNYDQRAVAFLNLGRCYAKLNELDKASSALQRSLRLDSGQAEATLELADVLLAQQKYADAKTYLAVFQERARNTARSLWIGIRIATALGDVDTVSSDEIQLARMFKDTPEYLAWQAWKNGAAADTSDKRGKR